MIGGNITVKLQASTTTKNEIGESVKAWHDVCDLTGFLDLQSGTSNYNNFSAKMKEATHIFICDYLPISDVLEVEGQIVKVTEENMKMVANSQNYDVLFIDNPMGLNEHLEIYLNYTGGQ